MRYGIVTGAAGELGRALCVELARHGWHVLATDVDPAGLKATRDAIQKAGGQAETATLDVRREVEWQALRERLQAAWPQLDLLVNNAGVCASGEVGNLPVAEWDRILEINLRGTFLGCHAFLPWLKLNPTRSHLVNIASIAGLAPIPRLAAYNASKAAVVSLSETLHNELRGTRVYVTAVCPAVVRSNLVVAMRHHDPDGLYGPVTQQMVDTAWITAQTVAKRAYKGMLRGRPVVLVGVRAHTLVRLRQLFGGLFLKVYHRFFWPKKLRECQESNLTRSASEGLIDPSPALRVS